MADSRNRRRRQGEPQLGPADIFPVVGVGASAGGIEALRKLLPAAQPGAGIAYVVVQHLAPDAQSVLSDLLARISPLPVVRAEDRARIEPDHVYVIPPDASLTVADGRLHLARPAAPRAQRNPIDDFLLSLARDRGEWAACAILSGTGSDGTIGLRAIKEHGGLTLAQAEAQYDGMMRSAVGTGLVDDVLPAQEMPARLAAYFAQLRGPAEDGAQPEQAAALDGDYMGKVTNVLRARTGHDFRGYKDRTVVRRVQRRMQVLQIDEPEAFLERLRTDPREPGLLLQDLLIGVTSFFRDAAAFKALEREVVPKLFEGKGADDAVRVWVPGCATGEEAYSIAMLLREHEPQGGGPKLQIFATDIDEHALELARQGRYPAGIAADVAPQPLERFFQREDGTYRVNAGLRDMCLFSPHNLLRDPPFSKLDLVSCRNLLIYLGSGLQDRVIPLFHYALRGAGWLFLGNSENVSRHSRLFATVDKAHRIFRRQPAAQQVLPDFPLSATGRLRRAAGMPPQPATGEASLQALAERALLTRYAPAHVVVDAEGELLYASARTGKYLELAAGMPSTNVLGMARRGLRTDLRALLHRREAAASPRPSRWRWAPTAAARG